MILNIEIEDFKINKIQIPNSIALSWFQIYHETNSKP